MERLMPDSAHYAKGTLDLMKASSVDYIENQDNPPNCPQLRPIERSWAIVKRNLKKNGGEAEMGRFKKIWAAASRKVSVCDCDVEKWLDDYGYCKSRNPIAPYNSMAAAVIDEVLDFPGTADYSLQLAAKCVHHSLEYWDLMRTEKLKPSRNPSSSTVFTSNYLKRLFSTSRLPGVEIDEIVSHCKTLKEGSTPGHMIVIGRGRLFKVHCLNEDGSILSPQQLLSIFQQIRSSISGSGVNHPVPALTGDDRTAWAKNRKHLKDLSKNNENILKTIDESILALVLDENCPHNLNEVLTSILTGENHSFWQDKSLSAFNFSNGKFGYCIEHSSVDGFNVATKMRFIMMSLTEFPEPQWDKVVRTNAVIEMKFDIDEYLVSEINRVMRNHQLKKYCVIVSSIQYTGYGLRFLKLHHLHSDAYIQMILQATYYKMHNTLTATCEPVLMAHYYNGRTGAARVCTMDSIRWVKAFMDETQTNEHKFKCLKNATTTHHSLMKTAENGVGIDMHLLGLWYAASESGMEIPKFYDDVLYKRSGGGGNYTILGSLVGYSAAVGCAPPMCIDGYTIIYGITVDSIFLNVSVYRDGTRTSAHTFCKVLEETLHEVGNMIVKVATAKL